MVYAPFAAVCRKIVAARADAEPGKHPSRRLTALAEPPFNPVALLRLMRPKQWAKGVFVLLGPVYGAADGQRVDFAAVAAVFIAFALASSACYIVNDIKDVTADRLHPRKKKRPLASGAVSARAASAVAVALLAAAIVTAILPSLAGHAGPPDRTATTAWAGLFLGVYVLNTLAYSLRFKHVVILDVVSLAGGFVLRVLGGCAAAGVEPSTWLLNCTFFVAMFLAFGKRLGEMRALGEGASAARGVLAGYTPELLRMAVVVTAVASLVTYAGYTQSRAEHYTLYYPSVARGWGFNVLWLTILPATFGLLRSIVLVERGDFDDPTELAWKDWPFKFSLLAFGVITAWAVLAGSGLSQ